MIISHKHRFIFFKPMKVAGSSIESVLTSECGESDILTGTSYFEEIDPEEFSSIESFTDFEKTTRSRHNFYPTERDEKSVTLEPIFSSHITLCELQEKYKNFNEIENYFEYIDKNISKMF